MQLAMNEEMSASRAFNSLRSLAATEVKESLELITPEKIKALAKVSRATTPREDISSAMAMLEATEANAELGYQRARPTLEVFGSYAYNGRDGELSNANKDAFDSHHPTWLAGLRFSTSFDFGNAYDVREGYLREQQAAELNLHRLMFDEQQDWLELQQRYDDILVRFAMIQSVEEIQKQKMDTERDHFNRGVTPPHTKFSCLSKIMR